MKKEINYAKLTFLLLRTLFLGGFFASIFYISIDGNFSISKNATALIPAWLWMVWIYPIPFLACATIIIWFAVDLINEFNTN